MLNFGLSDAHQDDGGQSDGAPFIGGKRLTALDLGRDIEDVAAGSYTERRESRETARTRAAERPFWRNLEADNEQRTFMPNVGFRTWGMC
jgi:hypothetical protein